MERRSLQSRSSADRAGEVTGSEGSAEAAAAAAAAAAGGAGSAGYAGHALSPPGAEAGIAGVRDGWRQVKPGKFTCARLHAASAAWRLAASVAAGIATY